VLAKLIYFASAASEIGSRSRSKLNNLWQQCIDFGL